MERRKFLTTTGIAVTSVLAGCGGETDSPYEIITDNSNSDPDGGDGDSNGTTPDSTETEESAPAEFELVSYSLPEEVEIGETYALGITIKNVGGQTGTYSEPFYYRTPGTSWSEGPEWTFQDVEPGESSTLTSDGTSSFDYINRYEYRLGTFEETVSIQVIGSQLAWGETFTTPYGYDIRVDEPEFMDSYRAENYRGEIEDIVPPDRDTWAFLDVYVKNRTGQTDYSPLTREISLLVESSQYDGDNYLYDDPLNLGQPFDGGNLQPGVEREGWIAYQVDGSPSVHELRVAWSEDTNDGVISVNWQTNP